LTICTRNAIFVQNPQLERIADALRSKELAWNAAWNGTIIVSKKTLLPKKQKRKRKNLRLLLQTLVHVVVIAQKH
jgi:hypothetical protein